MTTRRSLIFPLLVGLIFSLAVAACSGDRKRGKPPARLSLALFPVSAQEGIADPALAPALTSALKQLLQQKMKAEILVFNPKSALVQRIILEQKIDEQQLAGPLSPETAQRLAESMNLEGALSARLSPSSPSELVLTAWLSGIQSETIMEYRTVSAPPAPQAKPRPLGVWAKTLAQAVVGQMSEEFQAMSDALSQPPAQRAARHFEKGNGYAQAGDYRRALVEYGRAIAASPQNPQYYQAYGDAYLHLDDHRQAILQFSRALSLDPNRLEARLKLAEACLAAGEYQRAADEFRLVLDQDPKQMSARIGLARSYQALGKTNSAISQYQNLLKDHPDHLPSHLNLAELYLRGRQMDLAIAQYLAALQLQPQDSQLKERLAWLYLEAGKLPEGIAILKGILEQSPQRKEFSRNHYLRLIKLMGKEAESIASHSASALESYRSDGLDKEQALPLVQKLQVRSDNLAQLMDQLTAPGELAASHRQRVLASQLLAQAAYEQLKFVETDEQEHYRRAELLRQGALGAILKAVASEGQAPDAAGK